MADVSVCVYCMHFQWNVVDIFFGQSEFFFVSPFFALKFRALFLTHTHNCSDTKVKLLTFAFRVQQLLRFYEAVFLLSLLLLLLWFLHTRNYTSTPFHSSRLYVFAVYGQLGCCCFFSLTVTTTTTTTPWQHICFTIQMHAGVASSWHIATPKIDKRAHNNLFNWKRKTRTSKSSHNENERKENKNKTNTPFAYINGNENEKERARERESTVCVCDGKTHVKNAHMHTR